MRGFEPALDRILRILDGIDFCFAIRHAARKLRHGREKTPAVLGRNRFDDNSIFWTLAHFALSTLREGYQLLDVYGNGVLVAGLETQLQKSTFDL
jgi:hypothetical protein